MPEIILAKFDTCHFLYLLIGLADVTSEKRYFVEAPPVEKKSTVGAGDSMVAGITYSLQRGKTLREAIRFGVACGSAATMNDGTQLFNKEDAEKLFTVIN